MSRCKIIKLYGPPGTGKTTTLISTLSQHLSDGYKPLEVAFLSHTTAAANEVKDRVARKFTSYNWQRDGRFFRTIHSM